MDKNDLQKLTKEELIEEIKHLHQIINYWKKEYEALKNKHLESGDPEIKSSKGTLLIRMMKGLVQK